MLRTTMSQSARLEEIETLLTHLQKDVETLNAVILEQQREITLLRTVLSRLDERVARTIDGETPFDPVLEKPPHY